MEISLRHWLIALILAGLLHGSLLLLFPVPASRVHESAPLYRIRLLGPEFPGPGSRNADDGGHPQTLETGPPQASIQPENAVPPFRDEPSRSVEKPPPSQLVAEPASVSPPPQDKVIPDQPLETPAVMQEMQEVRKTRSPRPVRPARPAPETAPARNRIPQRTGTPARSQDAPGTTEHGDHSRSWNSASSGAGTGQVSGGSSTGNVRGYYRTLATWLTRYKRYPAQARRQQQQGIVKVTFTIDRSGCVISHRIKASSGHPLLDQEVSNMLQRASPMPPIPASLGKDQLTITVPIRFKLR